MLQIGEIISPFDSTQLYLSGKVEEGYRAVAVIVHGLCEHQERYDYFAELFHKVGIRTYRLGHRGRGHSGGERTYYGDFNELLDDTNVVVDMAIAENPDVPVLLIGHGMGGFTVVLYGAKYSDKKLRGIIISEVPTVDNGKLITNVPRDLDIHTQLLDELGTGVCSVTEVVDWYGRDPYNTEAFATGLRYTLCDGIDWFMEKGKEFRYPVLMLHGGKDSLVSVQGAYDFLEAAVSTDKQMKIYGDLFHEIFNGYCKGEVIGDAIQ